MEAGAHHPRGAVKGTPDGSSDPWRLVWGQPYIDAGRLARAIESDLSNAAAPDFRTRLLVRGAARAIRSFWGPTKFRRWLAASPTGEAVSRILKEDLGRTGFPLIRRRLVAAVGSTEIKQIFDLLGRKIRVRVEVNIAGSIPTLLKGMTARPTADIDIVNEVPPEIRKQRAVLKKIEEEYGLKLAHVQSHCLPSNWERRRRRLGDYGGLRVYLVDEYDIFVSKLSSAREKHKQDIRVLAGVLDKGGRPAASDDGREGVSRRTRDPAANRRELAFHLSGAVVSADGGRRRPRLKKTAYKGDEKTFRSVVTGPLLTST